MLLIMVVAVMPITPISVLLPGDVVDLKELHIKKKKLTTGPGLVAQDGETICSCKAGLLKHKSDGVNMVWVDNHQKRVNF